MWSVYTFPRPSMPSSCVWTRSPKSRRSTAASPCCPCVPVSPHGAAHDYTRHGTTSIFAALDIATGKVIGNCYSRLIYYCPEPEIRDITMRGLSVVSAEAFDGSEDVGGGFGPFEWLEIGIVMTDEVHNVCAQGLDAAIDSALDLLVGDGREESLDRIEPRRTGRRAMDMPARAFVSQLRISGALCVA